MAKKQIAIKVCAIALLVLSIVGYVYVARNYPYRENGRYYIPKEYSNVHLPATLRLSGKSWNDVHATDPSLASQWEYTYQNTHAVSNIVTEQLVTSSLKQNGFTISNEQVITNPYTVEFEASSKKLHLIVRVGDNCDRICTFRPEGTRVLIMAQLPENKQHIEI